MKRKYIDAAFSKSNFCLFSLLYFTGPLFEFLLFSHSSYQYLILQKQLWAVFCTAVCVVKNESNQFQTFIYHLFFWTIQLHVGVMSFP